MADARRIHIGDQAAAILRDAAGPMDTNEIAILLGLNAYERSALLWRELDKMARRGRIARTVDPSLRCRLWRWKSNGPDR